MTNQHEAKSKISLDVTNLLGDIDSELANIDNHMKELGNKNF